jgi:hypothetical protein
MENEQPPQLLEAVGNAVLDMAERGQVWLDDSGTLCSQSAVLSDATGPNIGTQFQEISVLCRTMNLDDILSMAARMAHTVDVSTAFAVTTEDPS